MARRDRVRKWWAALLAVGALLAAGTAAVDYSPPGPAPGSGGDPVAPRPQSVAAAAEAARAVLGLVAPPESAPPDAAPPAAARPEAVPPDAFPARPSTAAPDPDPLRGAPPGAPAPAAPAGRTAAEPCSGIDVSSRSEPAVVAPGGEFTWTVTVSNPNAAELSRATVVHTVAAAPGVAFTIVHTDPAADSSSASSVTFDDVGPIGAGRAETIRIGVRVEPASSIGRFSAETAASGDCRPEGDRPVEGTVPVEGSTLLDLPEVTAVAGSVLRRQGAATRPEASQPPARSPGARPPLPRTGGLPGPGAAAALLAASGAVRRLVRFAASR